MAGPHRPAEEAPARIATTRSTCAAHRAEDREVSLAKLTPLQVQRMLNELEAGGLAPRTVQYVHATLRAALKQALKWGLVASNVATLVDGPRVERKETQPLTPENALALLRAVRTDRLEALYSVAMALGLRRGEALGLRWSDVDLERRTINVRVQLQQVKGAGLQLVDVKTSHSRHILDLPDPTVNALQAHSERQTFERRAAKDLWQESGLVFTTAIGTPIEAGNLTRSFQRDPEALRAAARAVSRPAAYRGLAALGAGLRALGGVEDAWAQRRADHWRYLRAPVPAGSPRFSRPHGRLA